MTDLRPRDFAAAGGVDLRVVLAALHEGRIPSATRWSANREICAMNDGRKDAP